VNPMCLDHAKHRRPRARQQPWQAPLSGRRAPHTPEAILSPRRCDTRCQPHTSSAETETLRDGPLPALLNCLLALRGKAGCPVRGRPPAALRVAFGAKTFPVPLLHSRENFSPASLPLPWPPAGPHQRCQKAKRTSILQEGLEALRGRHVDACTHRQRSIRWVLVLGGVAACIFANLDQATRSHQHRDPGRVHRRAEVAPGSRRGGMLANRPNARRRMAVLECALWVDRVWLGLMRCWKGIGWT
jgi:hypothetical protein